MIDKAKETGSIKKVTIYALFLSVLGLFSYMQGFFVYMPSAIINIADLVVIEQAYDHPDSTFSMTLVMSQRANPILYIEALFNSGYDIYRAEQIIPKDMSSTEYHNAMLRQMENSQLVAAGLAMKHIGFNVEEHGGGLYVLEVDAQSNAYDLVKQGDIVTKVDDQRIEITTDMQNHMRDKLPGEVVNLTIERDGESFSYEIELIERSDALEKGSIGVLTTVYEWNIDLPMEIQVDTGNTGGASAGLMMTLEIIEQLTEGHLAEGYHIAGTGTINWNGEVGPIGGVKQKVIGAINGKADYFLVPKDNYSEAQSVADQRIQLVEVNNLEEALAFLANLDPK